MTQLLADDLVRHSHAEKDERDYHVPVDLPIVMSLPGAQAQFEIVVLRTSEHKDTAVDAALIQQYKAFRLRGLQADPNAFASSYLEESTKDDSFWSQKLSNNDALHFIAKPLPSEEGSLPLPTANQWIGMIVLHRVVDVNATTSARASPWAATSREGKYDSLTSGANKTETLEDQEISAYHLSGTFTDPTWRQQGIGSFLFRTALDHALTAARERHCKAVKLTVLVDADNLSAQRHYEQTGFKLVGEEVYMPRPTESGPRAERIAFVMELWKDTGHPLRVGGSKAAS